MNEGKLEVRTGMSAQPLLDGVDSAINFLHTFNKGLPKHENNVLHMCARAARGSLLVSGLTDVSAAASIVWARYTELLPRSNTRCSKDTSAVKSLPFSENRLVYVTCIQSQATPSVTPGIP